MYAIAFFGLLMIFLSILMIKNPEAWSKNIIKFSELSYFHPFEILSRISFGLIFLRYGDQTGFPALMNFIGYMLIGVGVGLLFTPPSLHRKFALWSAVKFKKSFRPAGFGSLLFGLFIIYASLMPLYL